jgi:hypothetical protein
MSKMDLKPTPQMREAARRKAEEKFSAHDALTASVKQQVAKENAALDAKTMKLRALRLAKEEADRLAAQNAETPKPASGSPRKRPIRKT